jgi:hypothetical protein
VTPEALALAVDRLRWCATRWRPSDVSCGTCSVASRDIAAVLDALEHFRADAAALRAEKARIWAWCTDELNSARAVRESSGLEFHENADIGAGVRPSRRALDVVAWCAIVLIWCMAAVVMAKAFGWLP